MTPIVPFGAVEKMAWWTLRGQVSSDKVESFGKKISDITGMTLYGKPKITEYPVMDNKGGQGVQAYFEWVESWLIIGTWPEIELVRVAMSTCAVDRFQPFAVARFLKTEIGPVKSFGYAEW